MTGVPDEASVDRDRSLDELAAALDRREREDARRWLGPAAMGLAVVAFSTIVPWQAENGPIGPVGRPGGPVLVWIGLVVGVIAISVARARPEAVTVTVTSGATLAAALVIGVRSAVELLAVDAGSAPWVAVVGAAVVVTAVVAPLASSLGWGARTVRSPRPYE